MATAAAVCLVVSPAGAEEKPLLWEIISENARVYLLGSIHLARPDLYPLDDAITAAFDETDTLVVEVDVTGVDQIALGKKMFALGAYNDGRKLSDQLSPESLDDLKSFLSERGFPFAMFDSMRPWLGSLMISVMEIQRLGYDPKHGIDKHFIDQAKKQQKPIQALETADFQISLFSTFPEELQEELLRYTIANVDRIPDMVDELTAAWRRGDTAALDRVMFESIRDDERLEPVYEKLIYERNATMTEKIRGYLAEGGSWFVVVGAGHLVGERGIVDLLENDGLFEIKQVASAASPVQTEP